jgi:hypothetical protein
MKVYVSYVIQDRTGHSHESIILDINSPVFDCSLNPHPSDVLEWANQRQAKLKRNQKLIITGMYKL